jgi:hypothetical protein
MEELVRFSLIESALNVGRGDSLYGGCGKLPPHYSSGFLRALATCHSGGRVSTKQPFIYLSKIACSVAPLPRRAGCGAPLLKGLEVDEAVILNADTLIGRNF